MPYCLGGSVNMTDSSDHTPGFWDVIGFCFGLVGISFSITGLILGSFTCDETMWPTFALITGLVADGSSVASYLVSNYSVLGASLAAGTLAMITGAKDMVVKSIECDNLRKVYKENSQIKKIKACGSGWKSAVFGLIKDKD